MEDVRLFNIKLIRYIMMRGKDEEKIFNIKYGIIKNLFALNNKSKEYVNIFKNVLILIIYFSPFI